MQFSQEFAVTQYHNKHKLDRNEFQERILSLYSFNWLFKRREIKGKTNMTEMIILFLFCCCCSLQNEIERDKWVRAFCIVSCEHLNPNLMTQIPNHRLNIHISHKKNHAKYINNNKIIIWSFQNCSEVFRNEEWQTGRMRSRVAKMDNLKWWWYWCAEI